MPPSLAEAATGIGVSSVFQPIVSLADQTVVGFEALTRWPEPNGPEPEDVFAHALATGHVNPLNQICVDSAIATALRDRLPRNALLLVNSEPTSEYVAPADDEVFARGQHEFRLMFELTERHLLVSPQALLKTVAALRSDGIAIALDDVGAHPDSLALMDIILPDVIKLDLALVQSRPQAQQRTVAAVLAHRERSGALILAEGIETDEHLERAWALGATLGQGFRFGRPAPLDQHPPPVSVFPLGDPQPAWSVSGSPFDLVVGTKAVRIAGKHTLVALSRHIEGQAAQSGDAPIVLTALQDVEHFTALTRNRYETLATSSPLVAVFGQRLLADMGDGVRSIALDPADPLCREWSVVTLGPHTAAALLACERTDTERSETAERRFDVAITYNRSLVTMAARNLLNRIL